MNSDFVIEQFGDRTICVKGIGKMYYQDGFPIQIAIEEFNKNGIEVSLLHVADELFKEGWELKRIEAALETMEGGLIKGIDSVREFYKVGKTVVDEQDEEYRLLNPLPKGRVYLYSSGGYVAQREMLFQYLFGCSTNQVREGKDNSPLKWIGTKVIKGLLTQALKAAS